jgi:hypothetical protein
MQVQKYASKIQENYARATYPNVLFFTKLLFFLLLYMPSPKNSFESVIICKIFNHNIAFTFKEFGK